MKKIIFLGCAFIFFVSAALFFTHHFSKKISPVTETIPRIHIIAAENFYGDIAQQIGGENIVVRSILSDPNVDPHEYESNVQDAVDIAKADIVIKNGLEYDTWMDKLLAASPNNQRIVITSGEIAPTKLPDNPHVWYGLDNVRAVADSLAQTLAKKDPQHASLYQANAATFKNSLQPLQQKMDEIKSQYSGTSIGLTETIYLYQSQPMGLHVLTPFEFEKAIAEGNDPSVNDVRETNNQIANKQIKILIYNNQTVTPITTHVLDTTKKLSIPIVPVSETMPPNATYQSWMMGQLTALQQALQAAVK